MRARLFENDLSLSIILHYDFLEHYKHSLYLQGFLLWQAWWQPTAMAMDAAEVLHTETTTELVVLVTVLPPRERV